MHSLMAVNRRAVNMVGKTEGGCVITAFGTNAGAEPEPGPQAAEAGPDA